MARVVQLAWSLYDSDGTRESRNCFIIYSDGLFHPGGLCQFPEKITPASE